MGIFKSRISSVTLGGRRIGPGHPVFVIAEAGVNHNGRLDLALRLVDMAAQAEADAVKFQTFSAKKLASPGTPKARYQKAATGEGTQNEMLRRLELSAEDHLRILARCRARGIIFLSSPFEEESADHLERLRVPAFKVPSGEITNLGFLKHLARKGKPLLLSTGMSSLEDVRRAVGAVREAGNPGLVLLHCVSRYPTPSSYANLRAMDTLARRFHVSVGFSDHTEGTEVALAAVARGACVIEKHLTLNRRMSGPDHRTTLDPAGFKTLVRCIRIVEKSLGHGRKEPMPGEKETAAAVRKSLAAAFPIPAGTRLGKHMIALRRPGTGLPPSALMGLVGSVARRSIPAGTLLKKEMFR